MKQYGKIISKLRKEHNMTQAELGAHLNVTYQAVSKWENDQSQPDFATMVQIADLFHVPLTIFSEEASETDPQAPVLGYCTTCGNVVTEENVSQMRPVLLCKDCAIDAQKRRAQEEIKRKEAEAKKIEAARIAEKRKQDANIAARNKGLIWAGVISGILLIIMLIFAFLSKDSIGKGILSALIVSLFAFTFVSQLFWEGFILEACIFGGKTIGTPGVIFSLDLDGLFFLIAVKLIFAILRLLIFLLTSLLSVCFAVLCSPFTFVPAMLRVNREGV